MITEEMYHHEVKARGNSYLWAEDSVLPFSELIVSFNAERPLEGHYLISISLDEDSWYEYVYWSATEQRSYSHVAEVLVVDQDIIKSLKESSSFKVKVEAKEGADLCQFHALHASTKQGFSKEFSGTNESVVLPVEGLSQLALESPYAKRVCAAASTSVVVRYLTGKFIDPIEFALAGYDSTFDVFGNWVFVVARAYEMLGQSWRCWVQRLNGFDQILGQLGMGIPVVVSVKGSLPGACMPYKNGHLIAVIGYDAEKREVMCMDPAYLRDDATLVRYPVGDFLEAWGNRKGLAFIFQEDHS